MDENKEEKEDIGKKYIKIARQINNNTC